MWCDGLSLEEWERKHEDDEIYLHGLCHEWVLENALHYDKFVILTEHRDETENIGLLHCYIIRNDKYVDVRGETENINDILDGFDYGEFNTLIFTSIDDFVSKCEEIFGEKISIWYG